MPARTTREEARQRIIKSFMDSLDRIIPPEESVPLRGRTFLDWEHQADVLKVPNTAMAVTIDIGDKKNVHPKDKQDVGDRLARIARAKVYGERIEWSGPTVASVKVEGASVRVTFSHADGLTAKGGDPRTFEVAGADGTFVPATARIDGATVVVSSPTVPQPTAVRYAWNRWPEGCNLYNGAGLPAAPFRTDGPAAP